MFSRNNEKKFFLKKRKAVSLIIVIMSLTALFAFASFVIDAAIVLNSQE